MSHIKETAQTAGRPRSAGLFDLRIIIAVLFVIYGVVLTIMGAFGQSAADDAKTGGININLWAGIVMIVFALAFAAWARWRPVVIEAPVTPEDMPPAQ
jgi:sulfite exporter TauE/SafE